ncbi:MAG: hypothetical protein EA394_01495 [Bacteroidia bacterium]|nr:MAG: hypothetical protein EA394_01495 [Bacteroidia bacterium]
MRKLFFILISLALAGCSIFPALQKSKYIGVRNLIDTKKYDEAKMIIEGMVEDEQFALWPRTWFYRGLLAQTAYRDGIATNDQRKTSLYTDQLYVAFSSFEQMLELDPSVQNENRLKPRYIMLANDFQQLGKRYFDSGEMEGALKAFEHAIEIIGRPFMEMEPDTNLIYNAGLAAYQSEDWEKTVTYLDMLQEYNYSPNVAHLLYHARIEKGDATAAKKKLKKGIRKYEENESLVLLLVDFYVHRQEMDSAFLVLERAISDDPSNASYHYAKGLIKQQQGNYIEAILSYFEAVEHDPDHLTAYINIATCYYNIGAEIEEESRKLTDSEMVRQKRRESEAALDSAVLWLDKAYEKKPEEQALLMKMYQLYTMLRIPDKARSLERAIY